MDSKQVGNQSPGCLGRVLSPEVENSREWAEPRRVRKSQVHLKGPKAWGDQQVSTNVCPQNKPQEQSQKASQKKSIKAQYLQLEGPCPATGLSSINTPS